MPFCLDDSPYFKMIELSEADSTNSFLANYQTRQPIDIILATADYQSAGRGQTGNTWESARGQNLLFSILVHPTSLLASQLFIISEAIALSLSESVTECLSSDAANLDKELDVKVKWPNDIYINDSKVAGILIETELQGQYVKRAIIGVGLNVNQLRFESDAPNPVSLRQLSGHTYERSFILSSIMGRFKQYYTQVLAGTYAPIHAAYRQALYRGETQTLWPFQDQNGPFMAGIAHVEPDGHLVLLDSTGRQRRYAFKEVSFILQTPARPEPPTLGPPA